MKVLVTGGAGYIGSHAVRKLISEGHETIVVDDLSHGHRKAVHPSALFLQGRSGDISLIRSILLSHQVDAVLHFAADIEVGESVTDPGKYYSNNFSQSLNLLQAMKETSTRHLVFSSTAAVYGHPESTPILESQSLHPVNPYGRSKMMTEMAIEDFSRAHGFRFAILRYFNVAGASPDGAIGEDHHPESHLIPRILASARHPEESQVRIYGTDYPTPDGTCIRDYVHVMDLVHAHVLALEKLSSGECGIWNLGSENGFSVREVVAACERVTHRKLKIREDERRPGDPPILVASSEKIRRDLGWQRMFPALETMIAHAWHWHTTHPRGFRDEVSSAATLSRGRDRELLSPG